MKRNLLKKFTTVTFAFILIFSFCITSLKAMTPTFPNSPRFTRGVGNVCYWISPTISSHSSNIYTSMNNWMYTGWDNPIYMTSVSSNYATHVDFYGRNMLQDSALDANTHAYVAYWNINGVRLSPARQAPSANYYYTEVIVNVNNFPPDKKNQILTHEIGHTFGLAHTNNNYSIMYPATSGMMVSTVQKEDNDTINYLY